MGESITEGTVVSFLKGVGDYVEMDEPVVQIETDKVTVDVPSPQSGILTSFLAEEDENVEVGQVLFTLAQGEAPEGAPAPEPAAAQPEPAPSTPAPSSTPEPAAPKPAAPAAAPAAAAASGAVDEPSTGPSRSQTRIPLTRIRVRANERLKDTQNVAAILTTFNEINMSELMSVRLNYKDSFEKKHGVQFGFMSAFVKATSMALASEPAVNSKIVGNEQVFHEYADIGIATATPTGLVVPVLRDAQNMSFADTERAIEELSSKAREGRLAIEDMASGTFTIANAGVFGALMGQPMLNAPQSAVLGMHGIQQRPVFVDNEVKLQPMMYVALTYDHRIIDGREAVTFLKHVKEMVEDPRRMILDL